MKNVMFAAATLLAVTSPAIAQDDEGLVEFNVLKPEVALQMAVAAMEYCRDGGYQVGVSVVDRFGVEQVFLRDRFAGVHVGETAYRKAWTSVAFKTDTIALDEITQAGSLSYGIRSISTALPLGGGVPVEAAGSIVAGIGVSGAPGPDIDDECAREGIEAIIDIIGF